MDAFVVDPDKSGQAVDVAAGLQRLVLSQPVPITAALFSSRILMKSLDHTNLIQSPSTIATLATLTDRGLFCAQFIFAFAVVWCAGLPLTC
jgi:hypothetical protein